MKRILLILFVVFLFSCEREEKVFPDEQTLDSYKSGGEQWDNYITNKEIKESVTFKDLK
jgi:hypothetical protein